MKTFFLVQAQAPKDLILSDGKLWTLLRGLRVLGHGGFIFRSWVDGGERGKAWSSFWKEEAFIQEAKYLKNISAKCI